MKNSIYRDKLLSREQIVRGFQETGYVLSPRMATTILLACNLDKPILVEGPAGAGKTELVLASPGEE